jgi:hypothetical protein
MKPMNLFFPEFGSSPVVIRTIRYHLWNVCALVDRLSNISKCDGREASLLRGRIQLKLKTTIPSPYSCPPASTTPLTFSTFLPSLRRLAKLGLMEHVGVAGETLKYATLV